MAEKFQLGDINNINTLLMICDMQEKFKPVIHCFDQITENSSRLLTGCQLLDVPAIVTEQYPKGLGSTVSDLNVENLQVFPKTEFTMMIPEVNEYIENTFPNKLKSIILLGVEAHVCVEQTAIDLISKNYVVHIVADCCSSRSQEDRILAFKRLEKIGCFITTSESVLFKLLKTKEHPKFKEVSKLVRNLPQSTGLMSNL